MNTDQADCVPVGTKVDIGDHTVEVLATPEETGDRYRIVIVADPGGPGIDGDFPHIHPNLVETFTCVEGEMMARVGKKVSSVAPGETVAASPGQVHGFLNSGDGPLVVESEVIFPDGYDSNGDVMRFATIYDAMRRHGPVDDSGEPPMLQLAVLSHDYRHVVRVPGVAGAFIGPLATLGKLRGYRSDIPGDRP